jgi:hypothetical protein
MHRRNGEAIPPQAGDVESRLVTTLPARSSSLRSPTFARLAGCLAAAVMLAGAGLAQAACPPSAVTLQSWYGLSGPVVVAHFDSTYNTAHVAFDLPAGTVALDQNLGGVSLTLVDAVDAYDVAGVSAGTPVSLTAAFDVNGGATNGGCGPGCGGWFRAAIRQGASAAADSVPEPSGYTPATNPLVTTLQLPIVITAGTPLTLEFELWDLVTPGSYGGGQGTGQIHFLNVPPGVTVTSCRGFSTGATPARQTSWGRVKTIYR